MTDLFDKNINCCGCTACFSICPQNAIQMVADREGFLYPSIIPQLCIDCGLCEKVCAFQTEKKEEDQGVPLVFAAKHKDEKVRQTSSSGGAFTALSDYMLSLNAAVYGAAFDEQFNVVHDRAENQDSRDRFKGSKYVQSDLTGVLQKVENDLQNGRYVLFTGTPCQCAGLKSYLTQKRVDFSRLVLCDLICHGTPSPLLWKEHVLSLENMYGSKVKNYFFRSKVNGWHSHTEKVELENGIEDHTTRFSQKHKMIFYSSVDLRPSCHHCRYTNLHRPSDLTIADFWGIERVMPDFDDNQGVSLILINSAYGHDVFNQIKSDFELRESSCNDCMQPQLRQPTPPSRKREVFWEDYYQKGYGYVIKKYTTYGLNRRIKEKIKKVIGPFLKWIR